MKRNFVGGTYFEGRPDRRSVYGEAPRSFAERFPTIPKPEQRLSPRLLAARWACNDLYAEDVPAIAADLLGANYDSQAIRRLAGETNLHSRADAEVLLVKMFRDLSVPYPVPQQTAILMVVRQIAREVIAGERNAWNAAAHVPFSQWEWRTEIPDLWTIYLLNEELDSEYGRPIPTLTEELIHRGVPPALPGRQ
jgi:hypothetical protein